MLQGWRYKSTRVNALSCFEPVDPVDTKTVTSHNSYPWTNCTGPAESYRFLSVGGTSARCRTHGSWGVQFICRRPGRQILQEKRMHWTTPHRRALRSLLMLSISHSALSTFILYLHHKAQTIHKQTLTEVTTRMKPNSSILFGFLGISLALLERITSVLFLWFCYFLVTWAQVSW